MARAHRPRATASSYPKTSSSSAQHDLPTPYVTDGSTSPAPTPAPPVPQHQPVPTPPYSSSEDLSTPHPVPPYPQPGGLMLPPTIYPGQAMSAPAPHPHSSPSVPPGHFRSSPGFASSVSPQQVMQPMDAHYNVYPHNFPSSGSYFSDVYYLGDINPYLVHHPTASRPPAPAGYSSPNDEMANYFNYGPPPVTPPAATIELSESAREGKSTIKVVHAPRPPNAWILYRSDKLKAIAAGSEIPGLDDVMAELGVNSSSSDERGKNAEAGEDLAHKPKSKQKKVKKGGKEPTEGMLSLGKGKTGRGLPQADISKMISMLWKRETAAVRAEYERQSEMKKAEHAAMYPGYKFQPLRKADKIRLREEKEREREAARREKDLLKSGSGRRRPRNRTRLSPNAPYPVMEGSRGLSRSLTYSGHTSATEDFLRGGSSARSSVPATPGDNFDDHRFRSYPFPMPTSSLPSMGPEDISVPYDAVILLPGESTIGIHSDPLQNTPSTPVNCAAEVSASMTPHPSQHNSPAPPQLDASPRMSSTPSAPRPALIASVSPLPQTPAPPPHVSDQRPKGVYDVERAFATYRGVNPEDLDAHDIVALWCSKDDDEGPPRTAAQPALRGESDPIGNLPRVVQDALEHEGAPEPEHEQAEILNRTDTALLPELSQHQTFSGLELRTLVPAMYPGGWIQIPVPEGQVPADPEDTQTHLYAPEDALVFEGHAYGYTPGVRPDGFVDLPVLWAGDDTAMGSYAPPLDDEFYLAFEHDGPSRGLIPLEAMIVEETGPFLSEAAMLSPTEAEWTLQPASLNAVAYDQSPDDEHHLTTPKTSGPAVPRHVSSSAFPLTPQSFSGSLPGNGSWNDRATSFVFANGLQSSFDMGISEELMVWGEDEDAATAPTARQRVTSKSPAAFFDTPEVSERPWMEISKQGQAGITQ